jgi:hypothetical protein
MLTCNVFQTHGADRTDFTKQLIHVTTKVRHLRVYFKRYVWVVDCRTHALGF